MHSARNMKFKRIFDKECRGHELDQSGSGNRQVTGACEDDNELWGSIKCGKYLDKLRNC